MRQRRDRAGYDSRLLRWVWTYVRPYRRLFWLSVVLMPLNSIFALLQPYVVKLTIDIFLAARRSTPPAWLAGTIRHSHGHGMIVMGALYVILLLGEFGTFYGQFYLTMMVSQYSLSDLRLALFATSSGCRWPSSIARRWAAWSAG